MIYTSLIDVLQRGLTATEAFIASIGIMGIISLAFTIIKVIYDAKKNKLSKAELEAKLNQALLETEAKYKGEIDTLNKELKTTKEQFINITLELCKKENIDINVVKEIGTMINEIAISEDKQETINEIVEVKETELKEKLTKQENVNNILNDIL